MFTSEAKYRRQVKEGLNKAFGGAEEVSFDASEERLIIFSDLHKGSRDGADDFWICERAYHAALGYYLEQGHTLYALGDIEELWECNPEEVLEAYPDSLGLEAEFHAQGRYRRFWGNHDDIWSRRDQVSKHLSYFYGDDLETHEALKLNVTTAGSVTGTLFLVHGHQGTLFSDRHRTIGRFFVHNFWRRIQRLTKRSLNTPARDAELRGRHDTAMYEWAHGHGHNPVLIAGHTHHPVFWNDWQAKLDEEWEALEELRKASPPVPRQLAEARAAYEHRRTVLSWPSLPSEPVDSPCYFNTGCCAFGDGDVTGIEIINGEIRLVRWLNDSDQPLPEILARAPLATVFERVAGPGVRS